MRTTDVQIANHHVLCRLVGMRMNTMFCATWSKWRLSSLPFDFSFCVLVDGTTLSSQSVEIITRSNNLTWLRRSLLRFIVNGDRPFSDGLLEAMGDGEWLQGWRNRLLRLEDFGSPWRCLLPQKPHTDIMLETINTSYKPGKKTHSTSNPSWYTTNPLIHGGGGFVVRIGRLFTYTRNKGQFSRSRRPTQQLLVTQL
jgi:hypothetical protein